MKNHEAWTGFGFWIERTKVQLSVYFCHPRMHYLWICFYIYTYIYIYVNNMSLFHTRCVANGEVRPPDRWPFHSVRCTFYYHVRVEAHPKPLGSWKPILHTCQTMPKRMVNHIPPAVFRGCYCHVGSQFLLWNKEHVDYNFIMLHFFPSRRCSFHPRFCGKRGMEWHNWALDLQVAWYLWWRFWVFRSGCLGGCCFSIGW